MSERTSTREDQLRSLRSLLPYAAEKSSFYRRLWADLRFDGSDPFTFEDFSALPFTWPEDLQGDWSSFLCLGLGEVARMVSLQTSGSTGLPKRLAFSAKDLEGIINWFSLAMGHMVEAGATVLILLPAADRPASIPGLLTAALAALQVTGVSATWPVLPAALAEEILRLKPNHLVATPTQLRELHAYLPLRPLLRRCIKSILSCTEALDQALKARLTEDWETEIFEYYASTESGYCGGMECRAHAGYHLNEADMYFEVVDPLGCATLPPGEAGEVVLTTLKREAMPLIRYRTGDCAALLPGPCACGSSVRRLGLIKGRIKRFRDGFEVVEVKKGDYRARYTGQTL